jgi:hypothetical protein
MLPKALWKTAKELQKFLDDFEYPFCFIGGIAVQRWGEPRVTRDVDATLVVDFGDERPIIEDVFQRYQARVDDAVNFALQARVMLAADNGGNGIDISLGSMPYERRMVERSSKWGAPEIGKIRTCSAEDLVVLKTFASRPQDWIDVEKVIIRQGNKLDHDLIKTELQPLLDLKEEPESMDDLESLFTKHAQ